MLDLDLSKCNSYQEFSNKLNRIDLMKIPLATLQLDEEELGRLLLKLEHIDLTDFNFQALNRVALCGPFLYCPDKFKCTDQSALFIIAKIGLLTNCSEILTRF